LDKFIPVTLRGSKFIGVPHVLARKNAGGRCFSSTEMPKTTILTNYSIMAVWLAFIFAFIAGIVPIVTISVYKHVIRVS
jgi:hypothetical protein